MSGIDNPIKKLKVISVQDAERARVIAKNEKEQKRLAAIAERQRKHEEEVQRVLAPIRSAFARQFQQYQKSYIEAVTNTPLCQFDSGPLQAENSTIIEDALATLILELKNVVPVKTYQLTNHRMYITVSVVDDMNTDNNQ
jgi:flagellar motor switch protein FliM